MSTHNWKEFLLVTVRKFREYFDRLTPAEKNLLIKHKEFEAVRSLSLIKPCQIVVFDFIEPLPIAFLITHHTNHPDLDFYIYERIDNPKQLEKIITEEKPFWLEDIKNYGFFKDVKREPDWINSLTYGEKRAFLLCTEEEAREDPEWIAKMLMDSINFSFGDYYMEAQKEQIGESTSKLKKDATLIPAPNIRTRVLEAADKIDNALRQMDHLKKYDKRLGFIEREIGGVRKLIGVTKEYQDFIVLTSAVDEIRKNYVNRSLFDEAIKRIDERINGVNTRIEDIKAIKFWSKRTIVDVILGAIATTSTLIAALLAAGILHV